MKIAVITPYYKESLEILRQCHLSVINQNIDVIVTQYFIADGCPQEEIASWDAQHIILPISHNDNGNTPRGLGSSLAKIEGYDFIAYLDADNWYHQDHLQTMLNKWKESRAQVIGSFRTFHHESGENLFTEESAENSLDHVDTSCLFLHKSCFELLNIWLEMPKILSPLCDVIFFAAIKHKKYEFCSTKKRTVAFRSKYLSHYFTANSHPPLNLKSEAEFIPALDFLNSKYGASECIKKLGFWPFEYIKYYNILFISKKNSDLCDLANLLASTLSNRKFTGYSFNEQHSREFNPHLKKTVDTLGYSGGSLSCNNFKECKSIENVKFDFVIHLRESPSQEMPLLPIEFSKVINWDVSLLSQKDLQNQADFYEVMEIMKSKILNISSLSNKVISLDSIETILNQTN